MYKYTGVLDIITSTQTMDTTPAQFEFTHTRVITRNEVKLAALELLKDQYVIYGINGVTYRMEIC